MNEPTLGALQPEALLAHAQFMRALARQLVADEPSADDVVQEAWLSALRHMPRSLGSVRSWLARVVRNSVLQRRRAEKSRLAREQSAASTEELPSTVGVLESIEAQRLLASAVLALDDIYREVVVLHFYEGWQLSEVARRKGLPLETVRTRMKRALSQLRAHLDQDDRGMRGIAVAILTLPSRSPSAAVRSGIMIMSTGTKIAVGTALIVALSGGLYWWSSDHPHSTRSGDAEEASTAAAALAPSVASAAGVTSPEREEVQGTRVRVIDRDRDLHGIVLDADRKPIAGAKVEVLRDEFSETAVLDFEHSYDRTSVALDTTDVRGEFAFSLPIGRAFDLEVTAEGFAKTRMTHCHAGEHLVATVSRSAALFGRVTRITDGSPVPGAPISLWSEPRGVSLHSSVHGPETTSDVEGWYRFDGIVADSYRVQAHPPKEAMADPIKVDVQAGQERRQDLTVTSGFVLRGRVVDAETGDAIAKAEVGEGWDLSRRVLTDARGGFVLDGCRLYHAAARAKGYGRVARSFRRPDGKPPEAVEFRLRRAHVAEGRVVSAQGEPVEGVYVAAAAYGQEPTKESSDQTDWSSARSTANGCFRLEGLRPDVTHTLYVKKDGFATVSYEFPLREQDEPLLDLGDVVLRRGATIRGKVIDQEEHGLAGRVVMLSGWNADHNTWQGAKRAGPGFLCTRTTRSDDLGRFAFADVADGSFEVVLLRDDSSAWVSRGVEVKQSASIDGIDLVVLPSLAIRGRLVGPQGEPVKAAIVFEPVGGRGKQLRRERTADDGSFALSALKPGDYWLEICPSARGEIASDAPPFAYCVHEPVRAGASDVVLRVPRAQKLAGRVIKKDGAPAANASVSAQLGKRSFSASQATTADANGHFELWLASEQLWTLIAEPFEEERRVANGVDESDATARQARLDGVTPGGPEIELRLP